MKILLFTNYGGCYVTPKMKEIMKNYSIQARTGEVIDYVEKSSILLQENYNYKEIEKELKNNLDLIYVITPNARSKYYIFYSIDYNHTFFRAFEKCDKDKILTYNYSTYLQPITSFGTTFASRFETYFRAIYEDDIKPGFNKPCIDEDLIINISEGQLYEDDENLWRNIIIKYFTGDDYTLEEIASISEINFKIDVDFFYIIPLLIFCLEKNIYKVLK